MTRENNRKFAYGKCYKFLVKKGKTFEQLYQLMGIREHIKHK